MPSVYTGQGQVRLSSSLLGNALIWQEIEGPLRRLFARPAKQRSTVLSKRVSDTRLAKFIRARNEHDKRNWRVFCSRIWSVDLAGNVDDYHNKPARSCAK